MSSSDFVPLYSNLSLPNLKPLTIEQEAAFLDSVVDRLKPVILKLGMYEALEVYDTPFNGPRGTTARQLKTYEPKVFYEGSYERMKMFHQWSGVREEIRNALDPGRPAYRLVFYGLNSHCKWVVGECDFLEVGEKKSTFGTEHIRLQTLRIICPTKTAWMLRRIKLTADIVISSLLKAKLGSEIPRLEHELKQFTDSEEFIMSCYLVFGAFPRREH